MLDHRRVSLQRIEIDFPIDVVSTTNNIKIQIRIIIEQTFNSSS